MRIPHGMFRRRQTLAGVPRSLIGFFVVFALGATSAQTQTWPDALPAGAVFWCADHEHGVPGEIGGLSQWRDLDSAFPGGGIFNTGRPPEAEAVIVEDPVFSGNYSVRMSIEPPQPGVARAVRLMRWRDREWDQGTSRPLPEEAYYSAWYYFPVTFKPTVWWNLFQFKGRDDCESDGESIVSVNVHHNAETRRMSFYVWHALSQRSFAQLDASGPVAIPTRQWVHLEAYYRQSESLEGRFILWQNGIAILDVAGIQTTLGCAESLAWGIGNYTDDILPTRAVILVDDAVISHERAFPLAPRFARGDVDQDAELTLGDPLRALQAFFVPGTALDCWKTVDANDDGLVNISDVVYFLAFLFQSGPGPEDPHPGCGWDSTPDGITCEGFGACP